MLLKRWFDRIIRYGHLTVIGPDGVEHAFGDLPGPVAGAVLHDHGVVWRLILNPDLAFGEAYMDGTLSLLDPRGDALVDLICLLMMNITEAPRYPVAAGLREALRFSMRHLQQFNPIGLARRHVAHHYDLRGDFYDLFLDTRHRQYSCAFFDRPDQDLETAQDNKVRRIAAKLCLEPGMRVLDIGSGWGGLACHLAQTHGVDVTGLTLSVEQQKAATERAARLGLGDRVRFLLQDYRELRAQPFDRIVSVGMFEHVGVGHFGAYFRAVRDLLTPDGVALIHAIGRRHGPGATNAWLRKYIFPGGYAPALSEVVPHVEQVGLWLTDVEILRLHYAETLRHWRHRFEARRDEAARMFDERFCRMWEFYLAACEASFLTGGMMVFQMQLARRVETVPITRDYMSLKGLDAEEPVLARQFMHMV